MKDKEEEEEEEEEKEENKLWLFGKFLVQCFRDAFHGARSPADHQR